MPRLLKPCGVHLLLSLAYEAGWFQDSDEPESLGQVYLGTSIRVTRLDAQRSIIAVVVCSVGIVIESTTTLVRIDTDLIFLRGAIR